MGKRFLLLFLFSIPMWWFFEICNSFLQNWHYDLGREISAIEYNIRASIDFSTVIPAVLSTTFLFKGIFSKVRSSKSRTFSISQTLPFTMIAIGLISFLVMPIFPRETYPLFWIAGFLVLDPINYFLGFPSILRQFSEGNRINAYSVGLATLFTGFWWEMWNFYSLPKWFYEIPYLGFFKVFEMPILGYLGYPFFGLELLTFTYFALGVTARIIKKLKLSFHLADFKI
jgi:hypothetical protein